MDARLFRAFNGVVAVVLDRTRFDALVFDLDGVVTRTAAAHARAWKQLFDEYLAARAARTGMPFVPFDIEVDYRRYVDGKPRRAGVRSFLAARNIELRPGTPADPEGAETVLALARRKDRHFLEHIARDGVEVFDGAVALLHRARAARFPTAVASSSRNCARILRVARLTSLFDVRVDGIDLERLGLPGKPAPDMFLEAARRLGVTPARAVVFEDATAGVEAGRAAGFGLVIGVGGAERRAELLAHGADVVVTDLGGIQATDDRPASAA